MKTYNISVGLMEGEIRAQVHEHSMSAVLTLSDDGFEVLTISVPVKQAWRARLAAAALTGNPGKLRSLIEEYEAGGLS